jgi:hypothetical protein
LKGEVEMKEEKGKKGLFGRLIGGKKDEKNACCSFQVIELPEEDFGKNDPKNSSKPKEKK